MKTTTAYKISATAPKPRGNVIVTYAELVRRAQRSLSQEGGWFMATEEPRNHWTEPLRYHCFQIELKDNGRVRAVEDLAEFCGERGLIEDCERCFGPGFRNDGAD